MTDETENPYSFPTEYGVEVYRTEKDMVAIQQEVPYDTDPETIIISPERVDSLIAFLRAVKDEIMTARADEAAARDQSLDTRLNS